MRGLGRVQAPQGMAAHVWRGMTCEYCHAACLAPDAHHCKLSVQAVLLHMWAGPQGHDLRAYAHEQAWISELGVKLTGMGQLSSQEDGKDLAATSQQVLGEMTQNAATYDGHKTRT